MQKNNFFISENIKKYWKCPALVETNTIAPG